MMSILEGDITFREGLFFEAYISYNGDFLWLFLKLGTGNRGMEQGMEREKPESLKPGTRKAGIFKTRNEKSRNL